MGYKPFPDAIPIDSAMEITEFTFDALEDHPSAELQALSVAVAQLLEEGEVVFLKLRKARRAVVKANARVRGADAYADEVFSAFSDDVLACVSHDRNHPFYVSVYNGQAPSEIEAMSLVPELDEIERILAILAAEDVPNDIKTRWPVKLQTAFDRGKMALDARKQATLALADTNEQVRRWLERCDRRRLAIAGQLRTYASNHNLPKSFEDRFFPDMQARGAGRIA